MKRKRKIEKKNPKIGISCSEFECHLEFSFASLYFYVTFDYFEINTYFWTCVFRLIFCPSSLRPNPFSFVLHPPITRTHTHTFINFLLFRILFEQFDKEKNISLLFSKKEINHKLGLCFQFSVCANFDCSKVGNEKKNKFVFRILVNK